MWIAIILLVLVLALILLSANKQTMMEGFNEQTGRFCPTCRHKTPNQCMSCFNCGFCVDKFGNSKCIGGDIYGPYNYEKCAYWHYGDPYSRMMYNNSNYRCSYGPMSTNRVIGV